MDRQQELQQDILWLRQKLEPMGEPELPLVLSGEILKQRAQTVRKNHFSPWRKMIPLTLGIAIVSAVGLWNGFKIAKTNDSTNLDEETQMASYSLEEMAAVPQLASSMTRVAEYSVEIETHIVDRDSKRVLRELYPGVKFYSLSFVGDFWTVICVHGIEGEAVVAVRSDEAEVLEEEQCYVVHEIESGKELRFDLMTLKKVK